MESPIVMMSRIRIHAKLNVAAQIIRDCTNFMSLTDNQNDRLRTIGDDLTDLAVELHITNLDTERTVSRLSNPD